MRRIILAAVATLALVTASALSPSRAEANLLAIPSSTADAFRTATAVDATSLSQKVAYACRRAWRCGPYDCGWRQVCAWAGWRPDWRARPYWRRHQWRRHYW